MTARVTAAYHVRSDPAAIAARAAAIAVEQSVEMPLGAIDDPRILADIVGRVEAIEARGENLFEVRIALAAATIGEDAGQLLNMVFGNTSLHDDVVLHDLEFPPELAHAFGGPRHGVAGLRRLAAAGPRALTCSALKPQGLSPAHMAALAERFARGGLDFVKDDHGLADQDFSRFSDRVAACAAAIARAADATGHRTHYMPSLSGDLDRMRAQIRIARAAGVEAVMLAPMVAGFATVQRLVREFPEVAFFAHPSMGGAARIAPPCLVGKLFRLLGADAVIFPNHGGRFGYSADTCRALAAAARAPWHALAPAMPVPAGGMTRDRVPEILDFYGRDAMLLIGGSLLSAGTSLTAATADFVRAVVEHDYR